VVKGGIAVEERKRRQAAPPYPYLQSQRDCVTQPRVARNELPWVKVTDNSQPQRGCGMVLFPLSSATTLSGLAPMWRAFSQGSSFLATLGFVAESLWDSTAGGNPSLAPFISPPSRSLAGRRSGHGFQQE